MLLIVLLEYILLLDEAEEHHDLVENCFYFFFAHALKSLAQLLIDEERDELGWFVVGVDEVFECLVDGMLEVFVIGEGACDSRKTSHKL